jgi:hypothetical protein
MILLLALTQTVTMCLAISQASNRMQKKNPVYLNRL